MTSRWLITPPNKLNRRSNWPSDAPTYVVKLNLRASRQGCSATNARSSTQVMDVWMLRAVHALVTLQTPVSACKMANIPKWSSRKSSLETIRASCCWRKEKTNRTKLLTDTRKTTMKTELKSTCNRTTKNPSTTTWSHLEETTTKGRNESR